MGLKWTHFTAAMEDIKSNTMAKLQNIPKEALSVLSKMAGLVEREHVWARAQLLYPNVPIHKIISYTIL
jgi:hypothetical protein